MVEPCNTNMTPHQALQECAGAADTGNAHPHRKSHRNAAPSGTQAYFSQQPMVVRRCSLVYVHALTGGASALQFIPAMALQERLFRSKAAAQPQPRLAASRPQYSGRCMLFRRARYGYSLRSAAAAPGPCDAQRSALDTQVSRLWLIHAVPTARSAVLVDGACSVTSANTRPPVGL